MANTIAKGIQISPEVWAALDRLRQRYGSIDAALRAVLPDFDDVPRDSRVPLIGKVAVDNWQQKTRPIREKGDRKR